jgi:hypothetical protein
MAHGGRRDPNCARICDSHHRSRARIAATRAKRRTVTFTTMVTRESQPEAHPGQACRFWKFYLHDHALFACEHGIADT